MKACCIVAWSPYSGDAGEVYRDIVAATLSRELATAGIPHEVTSDADADIPDEGRGWFWCEGVYFQVTPDASDAQMDAINAAINAATEAGERQAFIFTAEVTP